MNRLIGALVLAAVLAAGMVNSAEACYCGCAGAACCQTSCCCAVPQQCCTVMRTCQQVVYEPKQYTCYRTCYEAVWEQKPVTCVRYVPETHYRQCVQTVCRPVYETAEREVCCTVCTPVKEMRTVRVCSGHWEMQNVAVLQAECVRSVRAGPEDHDAMPRLEAGDRREASRVRPLRAADDHEESAVHGLQDGAGAADFPSAVHGVQGRAVSDDGPLLSLRGQAGSLHGHALRAARGDGASSGAGVLPSAFVLRRLQLSVSGLSFAGIRDRM